MTPEFEALARRAVACKGWRWMAGMLAVRVGTSLGGTLGRGHRVVRGATPDRALSVIRCDGDAFRADSVDFAPDFADPATLGCLLALVREAHGSPLLRVEGFPDGWRTVRSDRAPYIVGLGPTEAAALVAALEAAP